MKKAEDLINSGKKLKTYVEDKSEKLSKTGDYSDDIVKKILGKTKSND
jgi:hypothetical protein